MFQRTVWLSKREDCWQEETKTMLTSHLWLCVLCVVPVCSFIDVKCPRKDPPPGVVVISPGSRLVLTCSGHVWVDGAKVVLNGSNINKRRPAPVRNTTTKKAAGNAAVLTKNQTSLQNPVNERIFSPTAETGVSLEPDRRTASPLTVQPASTSTATMGGSDWEDNEMESDEEEGSRVTRGIKLRPQWKRTEQLVQRGDTNRGKVTFLGHGAALTLESVRLTDAGNYTCHHRGREAFAVEVVVADPPEKPSLSCYKKSPESKIQCEWRPLKPIAKVPSCYLLLSKGETHNFHQVPCSYSSQRSLCWCDLEHNQSELRTTHSAILCVTSITGNDTSNAIKFTPLNFMKPDPPSDVTAHQEERQEKVIKVTWNLPPTWKHQCNCYDIIYEIRYRPATSVHDQVSMIRSKTSYIITNVLSGVDYLIQLRIREADDGHWSDWSSPVHARSWTAEVVDLTTPMVYLQTLADYPDGSENGSYSRSGHPYVSHQVIWISAVSASSAVFLVIYVFRTKLMSRFHKHQVAPFGDPPPPSLHIPAAKDEHALLTFDL
uniref:Interleukin 6 receptor n=2 Tax=Nothobranchius TaxID=28779 RepID=A0A1A8FX03_9TELE